MQSFPVRFRILGGIAVFLFCLSPCFLITTVSAADVELSANLGDTITLHGFSYVGDSVYLFLTGPGLPANGVTLTDTSLRADQGHFTIVSLDDNQEWTYIWKTSRIDSEIDPGTYTVYVTNEPADLSHLGGTSSYKTLSVFLKDSGISKVSIGAEHVYTLNPEEKNTTPVPAPSMNITPVIPSATTPPLLPVTPAPVLTTVPATRAGTGPLSGVAALLCSIYLLSLLKARP